MEKNKKNVPKIRFKGFTEKWEEKEFSNTFLFLNNNTLSRAELNYESGSTKNVHYGDVLIKFGECLDISKEELPYITNEKIANKYAHLQDGDIIIADAAEDETVGKCTELLNVNEQVVAGLHTIACRPLLSFANRYLGYLLNASVFHNQLLPLMQGTKIVGISKSAIKDTLIYYPEFNEQTQIGNYFQNIDKLIEAKQSRIDKLKNIKKACLEKMFPKKGATTPEIRFKGFIGEWVLRQLDTMTSYSNGRGHEEKQSNQGKYELINLNSISIDGGLKPSGKFINEASDTLLKNDLVMVLSDVGHGDLLGRVAIIPENDRFVLNQRVALLRLNETILSEFLFFCINAQQSYFKLQGVGSSQLNISKESVETFSSCIPCLKEQEQIGTFFKKLDNLISQNEQQLTTLKNIKKACLEKMFVNKEDAL